MFFLVSALVITFHLEEICFLTSQQKQLSGQELGFNDFCFSCEIVSNECPMKNGFLRLGTSLSASFLIA